GGDTAVPWSVVNVRWFAKSRMTLRLACRASCDRPVCCVKSPSATRPKRRRSLLCACVDVAGPWHCAAGPTEREFVMNAVTTSEFTPGDLVYPRERSLGAITLVLGVLIWLALIVGTFGIALVVLGIGSLLYIFAHSALIAHVKGNAVELSPEQFPDIYAQL